MDPATIALLVAQLGPAAIQFFQGVKQKKAGDALAKGIKDPIMPIPASAQEALANAERNASSRYMPGQTNLQTQLNQGTANTTSDVLRTARSPQDALAALTSIHATNQKGQNEIGFQAAQNFNARQADLRGQQGIMSGWESKKWENDVLNRFNRDSAAASAMRNAGIINKYQGAKAGFNALGTMAGGMGEPKERPDSSTLSPMESTNTSSLSVPTNVPQPQLMGNQISPVMLQQLGLTPEQYAALSSYTTNMNQTQF